MIFPRLSIAGEFSTRLVISGASVGIFVGQRVNPFAFSIETEYTYIQWDVKSLEIYVFIIINEGFERILDGRCCTTAT